MKINIVDSSPKARGIVPKEEDKKMYPFDQLEVGQSFTIAKSECNWKSVRTCVYQQNARHKGRKQFTFVIHEEHNLVEVARIA